MENRRRFTGCEDVARNEIVAKMQRVLWVKVADQMCKRGFPPRTAKSVRNRHLRQKQAKLSRCESKNTCRKCGKPQRGHVCVVLDADAGEGADADA
jgi:hypothetical protein